MYKVRIIRFGKKTILKRKKILGVALAIQHFSTLINTEYNKHWNKPIATSLLINSQLFMTIPITKARNKAPSI